MKILVSLCSQRLVGSVFSVTRDTQVDGGNSVLRKSVSETNENARWKYKFDVLNTATHYIKSEVSAYVMKCSTLSKDNCSG